MFNKDIQQKAVEMLAKADNKEQAIYDAIEMVVAEKNKDLINELLEESTSMNVNNYRRLGAKEQAFYNNIKQAVTFDQPAAIPTEIIDITLKDIKEESDTLKLVNMAPAGVKKWITGSHSGTAAWGALGASLGTELTASLTAMDVEVNKLTAYLVLPKAIKDLGMPLVDKYFRAVLGEAIHDGLVDGFLNGNGQNAPIGIAYKLPNGSGTVAAKSVVTTLTGFTPKDLAPVKTLLANGGTRQINKLYVIANPSEVYSYVEPALYTLQNGAYVPVSKTEIEVIAEPKCPTGKAFITVEGAYTMGMSQINVNEYREAKALDDADVLVAKCYANGRPDDDATAYVFNPTKLAAYIETIKTITAAA